MTTKTYMAYLPGIILLLIAFGVFSLTFGLLGPALISAASTELVVIGILAVFAGVHISFWSLLKGVSAINKAIDSNPKSGRNE